MIKQLKKVRVKKSSERYRKRQKQAVQRKLYVFILHIIIHFLIKLWVLYEQLQEKLKYEIPSHNDS